MITVTDKAATKIKELLALEAKSPDQWGLRLNVRGGGCSGLTYVMNFDQPTSDDEISEKDGAKALVNKRALPYLDSSTLDYLETLTGAGFVIQNPNSSGGCGCGKSFSV